MQVKYSNPPIKLYVTIGSVGLLTMIVSMFLFPTVWIIGLSTLFICSTLVVAGKVLIKMLTVYHTFSLQCTERQHAKFLQVDRTKSLYSIKEGLIIPAMYKEPKLLPASVQTVDGELEKPKHFFDLLDLYPHLMLVAPSGSGKTTQLGMMANHLLQQRSSKLVWMSTHALEDKTLIPSQAIIVQSVDDIVNRLNEIVLLYKKRRDKPKSDNAKQIIVVIDEWYDLIEEDADVDQAIAQLSSGARKYSIVLILASHTENVDKTKLNKDLRRNFGRVTLDVNLTKQKKAIWKKFDKQDSWQEIELPNIETLFKSLIANGLSKNKAALEVYKRPYGGNLSKL